LHRSFSEPVTDTDYTGFVVAETGTSNFFAVSTELECVLKELVKFFDQFEAKTFN
jgi:hypothetical protein